MNKNFGFGYSRRMSKLSLSVMACVGMLLFGSISQAQVINAPLSATFQNPIGGGTVTGLGTNEVGFPGDIPGSLKIDLAPTGGYSLGQPFLLGQISFTAGGEMPSRLSLAPLAEMVDPADFTCRIEFSVPMRINEFREPGFRVGELFLSDDSFATGTFQDENYTLRFFGFTDSPDFNEPSTGSLQTPFGVEKQAYLWAVAYNDPTGTPTEGTTTDCDCHCPPPGVPEPTSIALAGCGMIAGLGVWFRNRRKKLAINS